MNKIPTQTPRLLLGLGLAASLLAGCGGGGAGGGTSSTGPSQSPNTAVVTADSVYTPGKGYTVSVSVLPDNSSVSYAVEDAPPAGWTVSNINEDGILDPATGKVKWGVYFDQCPRVFTYTATPPAGDTRTETFRGTLSVNGDDFTMTGQRSTRPGP